MDPNKIDNTNKVGYWTKNNQIRMVADEDDFDEKIYYYLGSSFAHFIDNNDLLRIDQPPEVMLENLDKMELAIIAERKYYLDKIKSRCPTCGKEK